MNISPMFTGAAVTSSTAEYKANGGPILKVKGINQAKPSNPEANTAYYFYNDSEGSTLDQVTDKFSVSKPASGTSEHTVSKADAQKWYDFVQGVRVYV